MQVNTIYKTCPTRTYTSKVMKSFWIQFLSPSTVMYILECSMAKEEASWPTGIGSSISTNAVNNWIHSTHIHAKVKEKLNNQ